VRILGLSALGHDTAAALLGERGIEAAIEESKLIRSRSSSGIPRAAIRFCLEKTSASWRDVACIAVASRPGRAWTRRAWFRLKRFPLAPVASAYYQTKAQGEFARELNNLRILRELRDNPATTLVTFEHHLCHAASAFYASPFDRAAILTLDGDGDGWSGSLAVGEGTRVHKLRSISFPHSLGWVYSQVTELLGFEPQRGEHKTQWLSMEGEPAFQDAFLEMLGAASDDLLRLNSRYFTRGLAGRMALSDAFWQRIGQPAGKDRVLSEEVRKQLAASVQQACTRVAVNLARRLREQTGARYLCLAGGVFLNGLLTAAVEKEAGFEQVFVQPAAGNEGTSLGAAWLAWHHTLGRPRVEPMQSVYWGPAFSNEEIKQVLDNCKCRYRWCNSEEEKIEATIQLLDAGRIVGWYQGATEFGPRALGNRSLLASPWAPYVKENLNEYVKHREPYRPFALSVPEEDCSQWFDWTPAARFLASVGWARPEAQKLLEGFLLPGGRVRLHVVEQNANPLLWRLLKQFGGRAPAPMLVNTSFNLFGEPLVVTPRDAVRSYFCSGVDALLAGSFLLSKT
jgi:carbamoyltransferase